MSSKASGKTDLSTHRVVKSNTDVAAIDEALSKSTSDASHILADPGNTNSSSSSYNSGSQLHFFGLAVTQTQTQVASSGRASGEVDERSESRATKRRKISYNPKVHSPPKAPLQTSNEPAETRPAPRSASKLKRRRSPSPASTDSFAEAEDWEDPAKAFLASNRQFEIPLSELGRGATLRDVPEGPKSTTRAPLRHVPQEPTQVDGLHTPPSKRFHASGSGPSDVQNEDILSPMSDVSTDAQGRNCSPISDVPDDVSTPPVMSNPGSIENLDIHTEDYQPTQPLAPEDLDLGSTQVSDAKDLYPRPSSPKAVSPMVSRPSTNTRTILSMVNPAKKWRLQRGEQLLQAALHPGSDGQTQPSEIFSVSSHAPSTGRLLFERLAAQKRAAQQLTPQRDLEELNPPCLPHFEEDSRETAVVPDSEPSQPANTASTLPRLHSSTPPGISLDGGRVDPSLSGLAPVPSMVVEDKGPQHEKEKDDQSDDDEEDIPLFVTVGRQDRGAAPSSTKVSSPPKSKGRQPRAPERSGRAGGTKVSSIRDVHAQDNEIPSSVPEQDHRSSAVPPTPPRTGPRRKGKECKDTGEDSFIPVTRSKQVTPTLDEDSTEPADDLPIHAEDDVIAPADSKPSSKRTRPPPAHFRKSAYRSAPRATSNTPSMVSGSRSAKRIKGHPMATRVFALWKLEAAYFSGMVCERVGQSDRFKIQFDDGDEDVVDVKNLRRLELRIGDRVTIIESQEKAAIANVDKQQQGIVTVELIDDPSAEMVVEVQGIKIQSRAIGSQWGNRFIHADEIVTLIPRTKSETPSSLRNSNSLLNKKVLNKVGIVVTLSVGCDREKEKEAIMRIIKSNGGTVLDDWSDVFSLAGEYSANKKRWVITSDNIGIDIKHDIQQVFLISDAANTKPRFLTALALGIPCLSVEWLRNLSSGQCALSDWPGYLLPAGYSDSLGARVSQLVDLDWGTTIDHLTEIMSNNVSSKLFSDTSVLVLGSEYFPPPAKGKKGTSGVGDEKSSDGGRFIPRIIVSMGAARVEAVPELKYSSNPDLKEFQYVVVKDLHERPSVGGEKYVSMEWVKDCLIAGRMFPPRV